MTALNDGSTKSTQGARESLRSGVFGCHFHGRGRFGREELYVDSPESLGH